MKKARNSIYGHSTPIHRLHALKNPLLYRMVGGNLVLLIIISLNGIHKYVYSWNN